MRKAALRDRDRLIERAFRAPKPIASRSSSSARARRSAPPNPTQSRATGRPAASRCWASTPTTRAAAACSAPPSAASSSPPVRATDDRVIVIDVVNDAHGEFFSVAGSAGADALAQLSRHRDPAPRAQLRGPLRGVEIAFGSDLPRASGLSSSTALVIGVFVALADRNRLDTHPEYVANIASPEDLAGYLGAVENGQSFATLGGDTGVGTRGGSQDHTAILCSRPASARALSLRSGRTRKREIAAPEGHDLRRRLERRRRVEDRRGARALQPRRGDGGGAARAPGERRPAIGPTTSRRAASSRSHRAREAAGADRARSRTAGSRARISSAGSISSCARR